MIKAGRTYLYGLNVITDPNFGTTSSNQLVRYTKVISGGGANPGNRVTATPFAYNIWEFHEWEGSRTAYFGQRPTAHYSGYFPADGPAMPAREDSILYNQALEKLNSKVRGDLDLSISIAEAKQTANMFKGLHDVLKQKVIRGLGSTKHVANGWLQWQYGWKPLCSDIFQSLDELIRFNFHKLERFKASASVDRERKTQTVGNTTNLQKCRIDWQFYGLEKVEIGIVLNVPSNSFDLSRWTSLNPLSITYELVPYSFVVDWFYDVGSWLRNLETALLYDCRFVRGYVSTLYRVSGRGTVTSQYNQNGVYIRNADCTFSHKIFNRTRLTSYPLPRAPSLKMDLGSQRLLSAAALLRQLLR